MKSFIIILILGFGPHIFAQVVEDPIADIAAHNADAGIYQKGQYYYKWSLDINHAGINDILLSPKQSPEDISSSEANDHNFIASDHTFDVYVGLKQGGYLVKRMAMSINTSKCYTGYIDEIKSYGIVTVESEMVDDPDEPQAKHGVKKKQVLCYTLVDHDIKRTDLTPLIYFDDKNSIYDKYLSKDKRTKVELEEVTPKDEPSPAVTGTAATTGTAQ